MRKGIPDLGSMQSIMLRISQIQGRLSPVNPSAKKERFTDVLNEKVKNSGAPSSRVKEKSPSSGLSSSGSIVKSMSDKRGEGNDSSWKSMVGVISRKYGIDEKLVRSVISVESAGNSAAVSPKGAMGLMQLMPATARMLGVDPSDPVQNLEGGVKYLSILSEKYNGDLKKTLAAYNAGPGRVDHYGGIPPFRETQNYVSLVLKRYNKG